MNDHDLERYARHLSLPEIGVPGQERLLATQIACDIPQVALALSRLGVQIVPTAALRVYEDETVMNGDIEFEAGVAIGPQTFVQAKHHDASAPLHMKERFLGALVASEIALWLLGHRPLRFTLHVDYPTYKLL